MGNGYSGLSCYPGCSLGSQTCKFKYRGPCLLIFLHDSHEAMKAVMGLPHSVSQTRSDPHSRPPWGEETPM